MRNYLEKILVTQVINESKNLEEAKNRIEEIPLAKVDEITPAVWWDYSNDQFDPRLKCSACGSVHIPYAGETRCPYCGAYMQESVYEERILR